MGLLAAVNTKLSSSFYHNSSPGIPFSPCTSAPPPSINSTKTTLFPAPASATLTFEGKSPTSPSGKPDHNQSDGAANPRVSNSSGISLDERGPRNVSRSSSSYNGASKPQTRQRYAGSLDLLKPSQSIDSIDPREVHSRVHGASPALPSMRSPAQLNLAELLRRDFDAASSLPEGLCNAADTLITQLLTPAQLQPSVDPQLQLSGNCAPIGETPPTPCSVVGTLPPDLAGVYIRNGPNAAQLHPGDGFHLFDGDGMLHAVKIADGKASFCARYVRTARFRQEEAAGRPLFPKFFGGMSGVVGAARTALVGVRVALGLVDVMQGWGLSNTSVGFFQGQVLSLSEDDMPYVIKITESGDLVTVGHFRLPGTVNMCAHPKFDASTGEMFAFSFRPPSMPPFSVFRVSADGVKSPDIPVPLLDVPLVHDFAITRRYIVFPDNQLVIRPLQALSGESALVCDPVKTPRFCLLPRYALPAEAAQKALWFDAPGCNCLHYLNAWDEGAHEVVLITPVLAPVDNIMELPAVNTTCTLTEVRLNTVTGRTKMRKLCSGNFEFGTLNQKYVGRKCRYVYLASGCYPQLTGVVKVDLQRGAGGGGGGGGEDYTAGDAVVARRDFGEGCTAGEPYFVPRKVHGTSKGAGALHAGEELPAVEEEAAEDDGYLLCYVHDIEKGVSELLVMDAASPALEVIASVHLPSRVPCGFHGWFVTQEQLAQQRA